MSIGTYDMDTLKPPFTRRRHRRHDARSAAASGYAPRHGLCTAAYCLRRVPPGGAAALHMSHRSAFRALPSFRPEEDSRDG